tara:strand:+ start:204 stop:455 length:252 start_codon:yes stop_codon:yes gene_type:complete
MIPQKGAMWDAGAKWNATAALKNTMQRQTARHSRLPYHPKTPQNHVMTEVKGPAEQPPTHLPYLIRTRKPNSIKIRKTVSLVG